MNDMTMTSNKPYLIRALHAWICDNDCTPYLYVNTQSDNLRLPTHLLAENPLILNASPNACKDLALDNDAVSFQARFGGEVFDVYLPVSAIIAVVARETGQGMTFEWEKPAADDENAATEKSNTPSENIEKTNTNKANKEKKGGLKIVR